jgi:hypothetical protein
MLEKSMEDYLYLSEPTHLYFYLGRKIELVGYVVESSSKKSQVSWSLDVIRPRVVNMGPMKRKASWMRPRPAFTWPLMCVYELDTISSLWPAPQHVGYLLQGCHTSCRPVGQKEVACLCRLIIRQCFLLIGISLLISLYSLRSQSHRRTLLYYCCYALHFFFPSPAKIIENVFHFIYISSHEARS